MVHAALLYLFNIDGLSDKGVKSTYIQPEIVPSDTVFDLITAPALITAP